MNMSHCRFHNTLHDLRDCLDGINDTLSSEEAVARKKLIQVCREVVYEVDHCGGGGGKDEESDEEDES